MDAEYDYLKMLKQLVFSYVINILVFIIAPLGTIVLSRGLSVADFGVYSLFFVFWNMGLQGLSFGLQMYIQNYLPGRSLSEQYLVVGSSFKFISLTSVLIFLVWGVVGQLLLRLLNLSRYYHASFLVIAAIFVSVLAFIPYSWLISRHKLEYCTFLHFINSTVWIILAAVEFFVTKQVVLWHIFVYWIIGMFFVLILSIWKMGNESVFLIRPFWSLSTDVLRKGMVFGVPLLIWMINPWLLTFFDRLLLNISAGQSAVGCYSFVYALVSVISSFGAVISTIFYPYLAKSWNTGKSQQFDLLWNASFKYTLMVVWIGVVLLYVWYVPLVSLVSGSKFLATSKFMPYLVAFPLFSCMALVFQAGIVIKGKSVKVGIVYSIGIIFNYVLNSKLIFLFGITGAAITMLLTQLFIAILMVFLAMPYVSINLSFLKIGRVLFAGFLTGLVIGFFQSEIAFFKIAVLLFGAVVYFILLLVFKVFGQSEFLVLKDLFFHSKARNLFMWH